MNQPFMRMVLYAMVGGAAALALQWHFSHAWTTYYFRFPWPGYQQAMQQGLVPAFLNGSPRSSQVSKYVLLSLPLLTFWFAAGRRIRCFVALWAGVMAAEVAIWVATPQLRQNSNMWPIDLVLLSFRTGFPLMVGALVVVMIQKVRGFLLKR